MVAERPSKVREALRAYESALDCPDCPNQGWYVGTETVRGADGLPEPSPIQVQCEFCETVENSKYRRWHELEASVEECIEAIDELTEALEDAIAGCSNPRQAPGEALAKYKEALNDK